MLGRQVAGYRRQAGLTQEELAARAELSVRSIRDIETGRVARPRPTTLRILADAFALTGARRSRFLSAAAPDPVPAGPAQLPLDVPGFTGRAAELAHLDGAVDDPDRPVVIFAVAGTAGVGKTALALRWAHRVQDRFPDGQLFVNLRGFDAAEAVVDPGAALRGFLEALDVPSARIPHGTDARAGLFRSLLSGRRMLVLLDNARDEAQVRPLLPGTGACVVVVTSRDRLAGLVAAEGARPLGLDVFSDRDATGLLASRIGPDRLAAEPAATADIIAASARLPLALTLVAARVALHPAFSLDAVAAELGRADQRLDALGAGHLRRVFAASSAAVSADAGRLFRLVGLHPGPDLAVGAAAALAGLAVGAVGPLLAELTRLHLLTERVPGRFEFHDLLRSYAAELVAHHDPAERDAARRRLYDHYLQTAHAAATLLQPQWTPIALPPPGPGSTPDRIASHDGALAYFGDEHRVLASTVRQAAGAGFPGHAWRLAWTLASYYAPRGLWGESATVQEVALAAARQAGDLPGEATAARLLARADVRLGDSASSEAHLRVALDLYVRMRDPAGRAQTLHNLAEVCQLTGRTDEALGAAREALGLYRLAGNGAGTARALNAIGWLCAGVGDDAEAVACCTEALELQRANGDRNGQAATLDSLAYVYQRMGESGRAAVACEEAVELFRRSADRYHEAETLVRLGDCRSVLGEGGPAHRAWQAALRIFVDLGDPAAQDVRQRLS